MMDYQTALKQLESLKADRESFNVSADPDPIYGLDIEALEVAMEVLREKMEGGRRQ